MGSMFAWGQRFWPYWSAALLSLLIAYIAYDFPKRGLSVPIQYADQGDTLVLLAIIQGVIETGWYFDNPRLAAPFGQNARDFPITETWHLLKIVALGETGKSAVWVLNVFFVMSYPLIALTTVAALRQLGISGLYAFLGAIVFTFLPYHQQRGQHHLMLGSYEHIPLASLLIIQIASGEWRLKFLSATTCAALAICALIGIAGAYYAFFSCYLLVIAALYAGGRRRDWRGVIFAGLCIGVIVAFGVITTLPTMRYQREAGRNPAASDRIPEEADIYGLKLSNFYLPIPEHRVPLLAQLRRFHDSDMRPSTTENGSANLGFLLAASLTVLLLRPIVLRAPETTDLGRSLDLLSVLAWAAIALGMIGGVGAMFNLIVWPQIRALNRISVFIAFFALLAAVRGGPLLLAHLRWGREAPARFLIPWGIVVLAFLDQTYFRIPPGEAELYQHDSAFGQEVERAFPPGSAVFILPYLEYPEIGNYRRIGSYDHLRPYLVTRSIRWNYGGIKQREADLWCKKVIEMPLPQMLDALAGAGFRAVCLDTYGYLPNDESMRTRLTEALGPPTIATERWVIFDLAGRYERLRERLGVKTAAEQTSTLLRPLFLLKQNGFSEAWLAPDGSPVYPVPNGAVLMLVNTTGREQRVCLSLRMRPFLDGIDTMNLASELDLGRPTPHELPALAIAGSVWSNRVPNRAALPSEWSFALPTGRHAVRIQAKPRSVFGYRTWRRAVVWVDAIALTVSDESQSAAIVGVDFLTK